MIERQHSFRLTRQTSRRKLTKVSGHQDGKSNTLSCDSDTKELSTLSNKARTRTHSNSCDYSENDFNRIEDNQKRQQLQQKKKYYRRHKDGNTIPSKPQDKKNNATAGDKRNRFLKQNSLTILGNNSSQDRRTAHLTKQLSLSLFELQPLECSEKSKDDESLDSEYLRRRREDGHYIHSQRKNNEMNSARRDRRNRFLKQSSLTMLGKNPSTEGRRARYLRTQQHSSTLLEDQLFGFGDEETNDKEPCFYAPSRDERKGFQNLPPSLCDGFELGEDEKAKVSVGSYLHGIDGVNSHGVYGNTNQHRGTVVDIYKSRRKKLRRYGTQ